MMYIDEGHKPVLICIWTPLIVTLMNEMVI